MSVLASKRTLSRHEYVRTFMELYNYTVQKLSKVPKRKYKFICKPISDAMNGIYNSIMEANNDYFHYGIKLLDKNERTKQIINQIIGLQKQLLVLWNIEKYETKTMVRWIDLIDEEIYYIAKLGGLNPVKGKQYMYIIDYNSVHKAEFLSTMRDLHRFAYTKIIPTNSIFRDTRGILILELVDEAWYRVTHANRYPVKTAKQYAGRKEDIEIAMNCLKELEQPMLALFNYMGYSETKMQQWANLITKEQKLLKGLQISDKKRFENLK